MRMAKFSVLELELKSRIQSINYSHQEVHVYIQDCSQSAGCSRFGSLVEYRCAKRAGSEPTGCGLHARSVGQRSLKWYVQMSRAVHYCPLAGLLILCVLHNSPAPTRANQRIKWPQSSPLSTGCQHESVRQQCSAHGTSRGSTRGEPLSYIYAPSSNSSSTQAATLAHFPGRRSQGRAVR